MGIIATEYHNGPIQSSKQHAPPAENDRHGTSLVKSGVAEHFLNRCVWQAVPDRQLFSKCTKCRDPDLIRIASF